ncbi:MAG: tetratricopeptide repeat protein, partial [Lentisphaeria bacterium]|nr:tetratricopeptide repeat protein [Lentisphaeria bacterium]
MKKYISILIALLGFWQVATAQQQELLTKATLAFNDSFYATSSRYLEEYLKQAKTGTIKEAEAKIQLAKSYNQEKRYTDLSKLTAGLNTKSLKKGPNTAPLLQSIKFWKAYSEIKLGRYPKADIELVRISVKPLSHEIAINTLSALAESKFKQNNFPKSIHYYMELTKKHKGSPEAEFAQIEIIKLFILSKKFFWAEREITKMIKEDGDAVNKKGQLLKLFLLTLKGEEKEALTLFDKLVVSKDNSRNQNWFLVTFYLAALHEKTKDFETAARLYARCLVYSTSLKSSEKVMYKLAGCYIKNNNFDLAISSLEDYLATYPLSKYRIEVKMSLVGLYKKNKRYTEALNILSSVIKGPKASNQDKFDSQLLIAEIYMEQEKTEESVKAFLAASAFATDEDDKARSVYLAAEQSFRKKDFKKAAELYELLTVSYPRSSFTERGQFSKGIALTRTENFTKANKAFESFMVAYPNSSFLPNVLYRNGKAFQMQERYEKAKDQYKKVFTNFKSSQDAPKALLAYSDCLSDLGVGAQAIPDLKKGILDFKESKLIANIYEHLIYLLLTFESPEEGLEFADQFIKTNATSPLTGDVLFKVANYWRNVRNDRHARREFLRLYENFPKNHMAPEAYLQAALSSMSFDLKRSELIFIEIVKNESFSKLLRAKAALAIGNLEVGRQKYEAAIPYFSFIESNLPESNLVYVAQGRKADTYFLQSKLKEAKELYQNLIATKGVESSLREQSRFKLAQILFTEEDDKTAEVVLMDLIYA